MLSYGHVGNTDQGLLTKAPPAHCSRPFMSASKTLPNPLNRAWQVTKLETASVSARWVMNCQAFFGRGLNRGEDRRTTSTPDTLYGTCIVAHGSKEKILCGSTQNANTLATESAINPISATVGAASYMMRLGMASTKPSAVRGIRSWRPPRKSSTVAIRVTRVNCVCVPLL